MVNLSVAKTKLNKPKAGDQTTDANKNHPTLALETFKEETKDEKLKKEQDET